MIRAVSFDLWDTVFIDDSDEPKRKAQGLPSKNVERRDLIERHLKTVLRQRIDQVCEQVDVDFRKAWDEGCVTWPVPERLRRILSGLDRTLPDASFAELVRLFEEMELGVRPDLVPGIGAVLEDLEKDFKLIVVSDAIYSPGRALRQLLDGYGLLGHFGGFVFSDEFGRSKPAPEVFR
ncbi:MAG: HAD family hydrolase, partial [Elusimicrobiota bacterium]